MRDAGSLFKGGLIATVLLSIVLTGCAGARNSARVDAPENLARLQKVEVKETGECTTVVITLDRPATFTSVRMPDPPKMVVDLAGVDMGGFAGPTKVDKPPVTEIRPVKVPNAPRLGRLEIALTRNADVKTTQEGGTINILFEKGAAERQAAAKEAPVKEAAAQEAPVKEASAKEAPVKEAASKVSTAKEATVKETPVNESKAKESAAKEAVHPSPAVKVETAPAAVASAPAQPKKQAAAGAPSKVQTAAAAASVKAAAAPLPPAKTIKEITALKRGESYQVSITGDGSFPKTDAFMLGKDRIVVDVPGVGAVKDKGVIEVGGGTLKRVRMAAYKDKPAKVRVVMDLASPAQYELKSEGNNLVVTVSPAGKVVQATATAQAATPKAAPAQTAPAQTATAKAAPAQAPVTVQTAPKAPAQAPVSAKEQTPAPKAEAKTKPAPAAPPASSKSDGINVYISRDGKAVLSSAPIEDSAGLTKVEDKTKDYVETQTKIYTGGRISFDIQDADLDKVIKLLADVANLNLILDPAEVKGKVTLKLENVPWDQALDILLKIYNLDKVIEGNVLRVASKSRLDDEKRRDLLQVAEQKKLDQQAQDLYTRTFKVNYTTASELEPQIKKILTARGDATANPRTNELVVTDIRDNLDRAGKLIAVLDKEVRQIMIEARIIKVDVGYSQSLGVSWGLTKQSHTQNPNVGVGTNGETVIPGTGGPNGAHDFQLDMPESVGKAAAGFLGAFSWGNILNDVNLDLTISALESINKAETLSAPKVFTLENQAATITSGTTIYVQTTTAAGTAPQPLNANLNLTVTPRVTGDNLIIMEVTASNNTPSNNTFGGVAAITTQQVTTRVLVKDGDTIVLGGVYTKTKNKDSAHVPLLGRIPLIKYLFGTNSWGDQTSELLIFITPKLMTTATTQV